MNVEFVVRYSDKRRDELCASLDEALACEDGDGYSAWPVAMLPDGSEVDLIVDGRNMTEEEARAEISKRG